MVIPQPVRIVSSSFLPDLLEMSGFSAVLNYVAVGCRASLFTQYPIVFCVSLISRKDLMCLCDEVKVDRPEVRRNNELITGANLTVKVSKDSAL